MENFFLPLTRDPQIRISCSYFLPPERPCPRETLIVFLNGVDNPKELWSQTIAALLKPRRRPNSTPILTYDRPGQGATIGRNSDAPGRPKDHGRDCLDAAYDLRDMIEKVGAMRLGIKAADIDSLGIVFVAASIGVDIARLYAAEYPKTVTAYLFMDSTLSNSDAVSSYPDPRAPDFAESDLPHGITAADLELARKAMRLYYHPEALNKEGLWRGNLPELLPYSDSPLLVGPGPKTPYLTVMQHDMEVIAVQWKKIFGITETAALTYGEPPWREYQEGLTKLTQPHLRRDLVVAIGAGHLIHKDKPQLVAAELRDLLDKLSRDEASRM